MNIGHVQGGTNAGWRIVKPARESWFCACFELENDEPVKKLQPGWRPECPDCAEKRPK